MHGFSQGHETPRRKAGTFRNAALGAASAATLALVLASPAQAQAQGATSAEDTTIIVTGLRGSLQRNLDAKREAAGVLDAITAEDIGKFPDSNVASALQRLPGVAIQRSGARGDATGVSIRGFGGDFVATLYDGRNISTATGGRGIDFTTIGADFVGRINVYKTPDVSLTVSAIGGTIDIQLPKPLDAPGLRVAATASGSIQSRDGSVTPTGGLLVSNTFADDTIGLLGAVSYSRRDTTSNHVFIPGWVGARFAPCQANPIGSVCTPGQNTSNPANVQNKLTWFPQQQGLEQTHNEDERIDGRIALQWQPTDNLLITLDDNFSRQTVRSDAYGYAAWFNGSDLRNVKYDANGTVVDFNQFGTPMDFNANEARNIFQTNQAGANIKWDIVENLQLDLDGSIARSVRNPNRNGLNDSMDIGYGGTNGATTILGANTGVTILGPSSQFIPQIHDFGPAGNASRFTDQSVIGSHVIVRGANYNTDLIKQLRATLKWEADDLTVLVGGKYMTDKLYGEGTSTFTNGVFASRAGYGPPSGRPAGPNGGIAPLPAAVYQGVTTVNNWLPGFEGSTAPSFIVYDPYAVYRLLEASGGSVAPSFNPGSVYEIVEKTYALFLKTNFETQIGDMPFFVSAGIRHEGTDVSSSALGRQLLGLSIPSGDPTLIQPNPALGPNRDGYSASTEITRTSNYSYLLPSLDIKLEVTPNLILRFDASRTLTRPGLAALTPNVNLGTLRVGSLSASGGNPDLKPYLADNYDLAAEWYYKPNSYFAVNFFLKQISNFIVGGVSTQTINNVIDPSTGQVARFNVNSQINGPTATVRGVELALQHLFGDTGFGFAANATIPSTNRKYDPLDTTGTAFSITGLAKSANFVGFYEKNGFQIRTAVNWRDKYLLALGQGQGGTFGAEPVFVNKQLQIDLSTSYDVTDWATVFADATNLNNSTYSTHGRFDNQFLDGWSYGRRFTFGVRVRY